MKQIDGTPNKGKIGANGILGVSMACCRAAALTQGIPLWKHIANLHGNKVCPHCFSPLAQNWNGPGRSSPPPNFGELGLDPGGGHDFYLHGHADLVGLTMCSHRPEHTGRKRPKKLHGGFALHTQGDSVIAVQLII